MSVTKGSDDLWVGVKYQSNVEIAGSPRNVLRYSRANAAAGGRALLACGGREPYQALANCEYRRPTTTSETVGANIHRREGNNPDLPLRSPSLAEWARAWADGDNQEVGLEAATLERVRNSSLV